MQRRDFNFGLLAFGILGCSRKGAPTPAGASSAPAPTTSVEIPSPASPGVGLRLRLLQGNAAAFGITQPGKVWGVATDIGTSEPGNITTIAGLADGSASLYTTGTFGIIGGGSHESVRAAALQLCRVAERSLDQTTPVSAFPYPAPNRVRFHVLTPEGVRSAEADVDVVASGVHPLSALFIANDAVFRELRKVVEAREAG
jgi:hypothetical protein